MLFDLGWKMMELFRRIVDQAKMEGRVLLMEHEVKAILEDCGITTTGSRLAGSEDEAAEIFRSTGSPVALKISSPDVIHKSDAGGVKLNLKSEDEVREAYRQITISFEDISITGISVQ
jgi:acyl-CoA synthetase (NDP forming)